MSGPLGALKVLDFSTLLPGPFATLALADMGAEVLRVEAPGRPDLVRMLSPRDDHSSAAHSYLNRNKRSLVLNLKCPGAAELVRELVNEYDIVVEQFRPGVMDRLGIGYKALRDANPRTIYCSITGYGQTGPYRDRAGHDCNFAALSGISSYTGTKRDGPVPAGFQIADIAGGSLHAAIGILAAVVARERSGEGQAIDISITDATFALNAIIGAGCLSTGEDQEFESHLLNGGGYYGYYQTRDGRFVSVGSLEPQFLKQLCLALDVELPNVDSFSLAEKELALFKDALQERIGGLTFSECRDLFATVDACVEPVLSVNEAAGHPQIQARGMIVDVPTPDGQMQKQLGSPIKFSGHRYKYYEIGKRAGADNSEVLADLGLSNAEIEKLGKAGVFG